MQILVCIDTKHSCDQSVGSHNREQDGSVPLSDGDTAGRSPLDPGLGREPPIRSDAVIVDVEDELDPDGYGFGV